MVSKEEHYDDDVTLPEIIRHIFTKVRWKAPICELEIAYIITSFNNSFLQEMYFDIFILGYINDGS